MEKPTKQEEILRFMMRKGERVSSKDIAREFGISQQLALRQCTHLASRGFITIKTEVVREGYYMPTRVRFYELRKVRREALLKIMRDKFGDGVQDNGT